MLNVHTFECYSFLSVFLCPSLKQETNSHLQQNEYPEYHSHQLTTGWIHVSRIRQNALKEECFLSVRIAVESNQLTTQ